MLLGQHKYYHQTGTEKGKGTNEANNQTRTITNTATASLSRLKRKRAVCVCVGLGFTGVHRLVGSQEQVRWADDNGGGEGCLYVIRQDSQKHILCQRDFE